MEPNVKDKTKTGTIGKNLEEFIRDLRVKVNQDDSDRANWKYKMVTANNQRLGIKRITNKPYPGAPDIPLPETDKLIKKSVPAMVMSAYAPKKKCIVNIEQGIQETPQMKEQARRAEAGINLVISHPRTQWFKKLCLAADIAKQYGHCIFRIVEDFCSRIVHKTIDLNEYPDEVIKELKAMSKEEMRMFLADRYKFDIDDKEDKSTMDDIIAQFKSGEKVIEFDVEEIYSYPNIEIPLPTKIIVPAYTTDINKAPRITFEYFYTREELEEKMAKGIFEEKDLDELIARNQTDITQDSLESAKSRNEGINDNTSDKELFRIRETCCWFKPEGKKRSEKWVFAYLADITSPEDSLLQRIPFPFEFDGWNYEKYDNEIKDPRYHASRGLPEQIRAYQETMERAMNNLLIRDEMNNTPMWEVLDTSEIMDAHIRFAPNDKIPVKAIGTEIKKLNEINNVDMSSERIIQLLKAFTEEYAGSTDQLFRNATNKGGGKTLGEIQEGVRQTAGPQNMEILNFNECLSRVYYKMFRVMQERLGTSIFIDNMEITREDFNFPADVRSNGSLEVADKEMATQKALMRIQVLNPATNPAIQQLQTPEDLYFAVYDWLEKDGIKDPDNYITNPLEIMNDKGMQMQQQLQAMGQQMQMMQGAIMEGEKEMAKTKKKNTKNIAKATGEMEADLEQPA